MWRNTRVGCYTKFPGKLWHFDGHLTEFPKNLWDFQSYGKARAMDDPQTSLGILWEFQRYRGACVEDASTNFPRNFQHFRCTLQNFPWKSKHVLWTIARFPRNLSGISAMWVEYARWMLYKFPRKLWHFDGRLMQSFPVFRSLFLSLFSFGRPWQVGGGWGLGAEVSVAEALAKESGPAS